MGSGRSSLLTCLGARAPHGQPALSGNAPSSLCTEPFDMLLIVPGLPRLSYFSASLNHLSIGSPNSGLSFPLSSVVVRDLKAISIYNEGFTGQHPLP